MNYPLSLLLMGLWLMAFAAAGEEGEDEPPSLELLEFLGRWETDNGERIDPTELEEDMMRQLGMSEEREDNE